jgi:hypothetical protein
MVIKDEVAQLHGAIKRRRERPDVAIYRPRLSSFEEPIAPLEKVIPSHRLKIEARQSVLVHDGAKFTFDGTRRVGATVSSQVVQVGFQGVAHSCAFDAPTAEPASCASQASAVRFASSNSSVHRGICSGAPRRERETA